MKKWSAITILFVLLWPTWGQTSRRRSSQPKSAQRRSLTTRQIAQKAYSSTVVVYSYDETGDELAEGSGFFVRPNVVATSYHVVKGSDEVKASMILYPNIRFGAKIIRFDEKTDLALLDVRPAKGPPISLATETDIYVGDTVYTMGNPKGLGGTFSSGVISANRELDGVWSIQFTAPVSPGSSGGPIINGVGEVIGVVQSQYREGQNLNFAVLSVHLQALISGGTQRANVSAMSDLNQPPPPVECVAVAHSETNVYFTNTRKSPVPTAKGTIIASDKVVPRLDSEEGQASYAGDVELLTSNLGNRRIARTYSFQVEAVEYNCPKRISRVLQRVFYDKGGKSFYKTPGPEDWNQAVLGTVSYTMLKTACGFTR